MSTPGVTIFGTLETIAGVDNPGTVTFQLVNYGTVPPTISGTALIAPVSVVCQAASDGTFSQALWGGYQISPAGTFYDVTITSADGSQVAVGAYQFSTAGSFDLSTLSPLTSAPGLGIRTSSISKASHQWLDSYDATTGIFTQSQPAFSDISGTASSGQYVTMVGDSGSGGVKGAVPAPGSGDTAAGKFLKADGTWAVPPGAGVTSFNSRTGAVVPATNDYSFSQISGTAATGQIPALDASKITTGQVAPARGGTGADLSATGGTHQVLKQASVGGAVTVGQLAFTDISGSVAATQLPNPSATTLGGVESAAAAAHQWIDSISTSGVPHLSQPSVTDLSEGSVGSGTVVRSSGAVINSPTIGGATISSGGLSFAGSSSGFMTLQPASAASGTLTMPSATDQLVARATADTLTNKIIDSASNTLELGGAAISITSPSSGQVLGYNGTNWVNTAGSGGITNSAATSIVPVTTDGSGDLGTSPIWANSTEVRIGSTTNIVGNSSRLYVFGGANGANVDVQADGSTASSDVAQVEVEGSDYATHVNSVAMRYFGPTALGSFCGIAAQSVGVLDFIGTTTTAGIIRSGGNFPLVLGTNDVERYRINATGESKFSSSLIVTGAVNVSQVAAPAAPTVAPHNGSASTWAYKIVAYDNNNQPTTGSTAGQTTSGAATLDSTHWNQITWSEVAGASYYKVFRTTVATSPSTTGVIGTVNSGSTMTLRDNGLSGDSSSVPVANTTGEVTVPALVLNGTTLNAVTGSGSVVLATSPTLVTPVLGTPTSGTLTNCTIPFSAITSATNSSATMAVGTGGSLTTSGTGSITATNGTALINVKVDGAVGDGSTNDHTAIQTAFTATGSANPGVYFPATSSNHSYVNSSAVTDPSAGTLQFIKGEGNLSGLSTSGTNNLLTLTHVTDNTLLAGFKITDMNFAGNTTPASIGSQALVALSNANSNSSGGVVSGLQLDNVQLVNSAGPGMTVAAPILTNIKNVTAFGCAEGLVYNTNGTTVVEQSTYMNSNLAAGRVFNGQQSIAMIGTAQDTNGIGTLFNGALAIGVVGSDAENGTAWNQSITTVARSGSTATITVANTYSAGQTVLVKGLTGGNAPLNGRWKIATASGSQFTYTTSTSGTIGSNNPAGATSSVYPGDQWVLSNGTLCGGMLGTQMFTPADPSSAFMVVDGTSGLFSVTGYYNNSGGVTNDVILMPNTSGTVLPMEFRCCSFGASTEANAIQQINGANYLTTSCAFGGTVPYIQHIVVAGNPTASTAALCIEDGTVFASSIPLISLTQHNSSDTGNVIQISNAGTASNDISSTNWVMSQAGKITKYAGATTSGQGLPPVTSTDSSTTLTANYNSGSAKTIVSSPTAGSLFRISGFQAINRAATTSSTFPSLTLGYTDAGGVARTLALVSTSTSNATTVITQFSTTIYVNSTNVTLTSASYASSGGTSMRYSLAYAVEQLI